MNSEHARTQPLRPPLAIIVAMTNDRVIGDHGSIPWDLPDDRRLFRELTMGGILIMGRRTFESIGVPLAGRRCLVVSRSRQDLTGAELCASLEEALDLAWQTGSPTFVIGGVEFYRRALPIADTLHVSWVAGDYAGDRRFPEFDLSGWTLGKTVEYPGFCYCRYHRNNFPDDQGT